MTATMRPTETRYKGRRFRSRLEARHAVFYDHLGIPWEFEDHDFLLPSGIRYLPDFWLPKQDCFIEIKGTNPTPEELAKCDGLATVTGKNVYCFFGSIKSPEYQDFENNDGAYAWLPNGSEVAWDNFYQWCECSRCGFFGVEYSGRSERLCCPCVKDSPKVYNYDTPRLERAYDAATSARFEFGEEG